MTFIIFDLDGTLANITHRAHHVRNGGRNWDAFFAECVHDAPNEAVIAALHAHEHMLDRIEIWSGRSDAVYAETRQWLYDNGINPNLLTHMREAGDFTPDVDLKRSWLHELHPDERPDLVYDDRGRVVQMWRDEGLTCFQVAPDWEGPRTIEPVAETLLTVMVGPSGGGKSRYAAWRFLDAEIISSDDLRIWYTGTIQDQSRNDDVFTALHRLAKARLDCGLPVTIDATNLRRKDRLACVKLAPAGTRVRYVVVDRPLAEKQRDAGWRNDVLVRGRPLIEVHHERFQSVLKDVLSGDGLAHVYVVDARLSGPYPWERAA